MFMMVLNDLDEFVKWVMWKRISNSLHYRRPGCASHCCFASVGGCFCGLDQKSPRRTLQNCQTEIEKLKKQLHVVDAWPLLDLF